MRVYSMDSSELVDEAGGILLQTLEAEEDDIDELNDETFGSGAIENDWEASHLSTLKALHSEGKEIPGPSHHHDSLFASPLSSGTSNGPSSSSNAGAINENPIPGFAQQLNIKDLWPSSPERSSTIDTIWSPQGLPPPQPAMVSSTNSTPPQPHGKVMTLEDLERQLLDSSSPPSTSPSLPPLLTQALHPKQPVQSLPTQPLSVSPQPLPVPPQQHPYLIPQPMGLPPGLTPPLGSSPHHHQPPPPHFHKIPLLPHGGPLLPHQQRPFVHPMVHPRFPLPHLPPNIPMRGPPRMIPGFFPHGQPHPIPPPHLLHHFLPHPPPNQPPRRSPPPSKRSELLCDLKPDGSGFMSRKEREWVVKVQLMQLNTNNPEIDDYYYQRFTRRKAASESEGVVTGNKAALSTPQLPVDKEREEKVYHPAEFKDTLGKISVSTLAAPRKTIDVSSFGGGAEREGSKWKVVMVAIEEIYSVLLKLEEVEYEALTMQSEQEKLLVEKKRGLSAKAFSLLQLGEEEQFFVQIMTHRKGKRAVERLLPSLCDSHAQSVVVAVLKNLYSIIRKDSTDRVLPLVAPSVCGVIMGLALSQVNAYLSFLCPTETKIAAKMVVNEFYNVVTTALLKRGCALTSDETNNHYIKSWQACTLKLYNLLSSIAKMKSSSLLSLLSTLPHLSS